ncbi:MAG: CsgG/HfaB family protein [Mobilitalea sp.]
MRKKLFFSLFILLFVFGFMIQGIVHAEEAERKEFKYSQEKLNRVKEKNIRYRVAIGSFGESINVTGSPFNKAAENSKTYNLNIASPNLEKPGVPQVNSVVGMLSDLLQKSDKFEIVERQEVNQLIREIQFEKSDWVKKDPANKLGNIYGVQYILLGEVLPNYGGEQFGSSQYTTTLRLVDVNTGAVISTGIGQRDYLKNALASAVHTLLNDLEGNPWTCRVVRLDDKGVYINAGLDDKIEKNDVFAVIRLEDPIKDLATGQVLGYKQTEIAKIKITDVLEKSLSLVKPVDVKAPIQEGDIVLAKRVILEKNTETHLWNQIFGNNSSER